jgi:uncharacterized protein (TIGR00255 family)
MKVRSMTGFARVRRVTKLGEIIATLKSVNHRALDIHSHLPAELEPYEPALRAAIKQSIARGHVDVRMAYLPTVLIDGPGLNKPLFEAYLGAFRVAAKEYGLEADPDLNAAFRIPGMLSQRGEPDENPELEAEVVATLTEALSSFNHFREREGAELAAAMRACCAEVIRDAAELERLRTLALPAFRARLEERIAELLKGANIEPARLAQEASMLADRSDITEELARLKVHAEELDAILARGGEVGKKLDFLLQEMNRETTTTLSKSAGAGEVGMKITERGLAVKSNIERIREQALNLE